MEVRRLIRSTFVFSLGFLLLSCGLQWLYRSYVVPDTRENGMWQALEAGQDKIETLFLGDSHPMKAVDTSAIPGSYLYAATGESYTLNRLRLRRLLEAGIRPARVVLPLDLHGFARYRRDFATDDNFWVRQPEYLALGHEKGRFGRYLLRHVRARALGYVGQYRRIFFAVWPELPAYQKVGPGQFALLDASGIGAMGRELEADGRSTAEVHFQDGTGYPDPVLKADFEQLLRMCAAHNIPVALVQFPVSRAYWVRATELLGAAATAPVRRYTWQGKQVPVWDARQLYFDQPDFFLDAHHLNPLGRADFSARLSAWLHSLD